MDEVSGCLDHYCRTAFAFPPPRKVRRGPMVMLQFHTRLTQAQAFLCHQQLTAIPSQCKYASAQGKASSLLSFFFFFFFFIAMPTKSVLELQCKFLLHTEDAVVL